MTRVLLVALAGALGAAARYGIGLAVGTRSFPWATLGINVTGSFLLAFVLAGPLAARLSPDLQVALAVGFLGAYTTYSTFSHEAVALWRAGRPGNAAAYVLASVVVGLGAAALGHAAGRSLAH